MYFSFKLVEQKKNIYPGESCSMRVNKEYVFQMKLELWDAAMSSLRHVLRIEPNNEKALYRKSKILAEKGCVEEAIGALRRCTRHGHLFILGVFLHSLCYNKNLLNLVNFVKISRNASGHLNWHFG